MSYRVVLYRLKNILKFDTKRYTQKLREEKYRYTDHEDSHNLSNLTLQKGKVILPCYNMLRTGTCIKGAECKYSHSIAELIRAWQDVFTELEASPFNPNKHLTPGNTKNTYNTPSCKTLQCIVEDIITPDIFILGFLRDVRSNNVFNNAFQSFR